MIHLYRQSKQKTSYTKGFRINKKNSLFKREKRQKSKIMFAKDFRITIYLNKKAKRLKGFRTKTTIKKFYLSRDCFANFDKIIITNFCSLDTRIKELTYEIVKNFLRNAINEDAK